MMDNFENLVAAGLGLYIDAASRQASKAFHATLPSLVEHLLTVQPVLAYFIHFFRV